MPVPKNLARNEREWRALVRSNDRSVVRTMRDWQRLLASRDSPLAGVDERVVAAFTRTLKFKKGGFAHADYSMLVDVVPFSRFRRIWEHFGMSLELFADYDGYRCVSTGTCGPMQSHICTSNC